MTEAQKRRFWEILPVFAIGAMLLIFIVVCAVYCGRCEQALSRLQTGWSLSGMPFEKLPAREIVPAGEATRMQICLGEEFAEPQALCFFSVYEDITVRIEGETIYRFEKPDGERITRAAPSFWNIVSLPGGSSGTMLEIELSTPYQSYANTIPELRYGELRQVYQYVQAETVPRFVAALAIMFIGLIFCIVAVILRFYIDEIGGLYSLSLFFIILAVFLASQQTSILLSLYGHSSYIIIQHIALMMCPVMYTRYLTRINKGLVKKVAWGMHLAFIFNFALICLLQLLQ